MGGRSSEGLYEIYKDFRNRDLEKFKEKAM